MAGVQILGITPIKAIRAKCLDCCCGQRKEVMLCPCGDCPLYLYRFGKNPKLKGCTNKGSFSQKTSAQPVSFGCVISSEGNYTPETEKAAEGHADT